MSGTPLAIRDRVEAAITAALNRCGAEDGLSPVSWQVSWDEGIFIEAAILDAGDSAAARDGWIRALRLEQYGFTGAGSEVWFAAGGGWLIEMTFETAISETPITEPTALIDELVE